MRAILPNLILVKLPTIWYLLWHKKDYVLLAAPEEGSAIDDNEMNATTCMLIAQCTYVHLNLYPQHLSMKCILFTMALGQKVSGQKELHNY